MRTNVKTVKVGVLLELRNLVNELQCVNLQQT